MVSLLSTKHDRLDATQYGFEEVDDLLTPKVDPNPIPDGFATHCICLNVGDKGVHALVTLNPAAHSADVSGLVAECKNVFGKT